ncbi:MAG TPA: hypothetical protein VG935_01560 [Patescibacteria group bacterium]|nr:hypothetical protein [Patescibacteria group bacterium]
MSLPPVKRLFGFVISLSLLFSFTLLPTFAQTTTATSDPSDMHYKAQEVIIDLSAAIICQLIGQDIVHPGSGCLSIDPVSQTLKPTASSQPLGGLIGTMTTMIGGMYQKPISTGSYFEYMASQFGLFKKTYAANQTGFDKLQPLQGVWLKLRNITFILMILIFIFIGIGIMLRLKIDPRTVMSIQNQLPKIVITLILISFSYAIAGLLVDSMWVVTYVGINVLVPDQVNCLNPKDANNLTPIELDQADAIKGSAERDLLNNPIAYINGLFGNNTGCQGFDVNILGHDLGNVDGIAGIAGNAAGPLSTVISTTIINSLLGLSDNASCSIGASGVHLSGCGEAILYGLVKAIASVLIFLILLLAILFALVRLWFALLRAYVYTLIGTMIAPIYIGVGLLPGSKFGFSAWMRFMLAHLAVFPLTAFLFVIARIISTIPTYNTADKSSVYYLPSFIGNPSVTNHIQSLLVVGVLMITPEVLTLTRQIFHSEPNKLISNAIVTGVGRGVAPVMTPVKTAAKRPFAYDKQTHQAGWARYGMTRLPGIRQMRESQRAPFRWFRGGRIPFPGGGNQQNP